MRVSDANPQPTLSSPLDTTAATRLESAPPTVLFFLLYLFSYSSSTTTFGIYRQIGDGVEEKRAKKKLLDDSLRFC